MRALSSPDLVAQRRAWIGVSVLVNARRCFSTDFKEVEVRPRLKKTSGLNASDLKNFRPVSNLSSLNCFRESSRTPTQNLPEQQRLDADKKQSA